MMGRCQATRQLRAVWWRVVVIGFLVLALAACTPLQSSRFEKHWADGDAVWLAGQTVDCNGSSTHCARQHLFKGVACLQLAPTAPAPATQYACAARQLHQGLTLHPTWKSPADQVYYQQQLCEALEKLHPLQSGEAAGRTLEQLGQAAKTLYRLEPESVAAIYYLASLRLRQAEPDLGAISTGTRLPVCNRLNRALNRVLAVMTADPETRPGWDQFAEKYDQLVFHLGVALRTAGCR
ncbi:hypothetical protein [Desulfosarcina ovata]|uniref:Lipoprotein n=1 Tax=Desulfosarcina ovata subsp. ovata TaxID=2752305 RepID=A0A5K8AI47_9BACT|nr:hypothetical protein [Desulfosarcina ovata]BBO92159.1 hypothetical protein DSCOOX_53390 [Desulfosarcina ovata subsp. ovata]